MKRAVPSINPSIHPSIHPSVRPSTQPFINVRQATHSSGSARSSITEISALSHLSLNVPFTVARGSTVTLEARFALNNAAELLQSIIWYRNDEEFCRLIVRPDGGFTDIYTDREGVYIDVSDLECCFPPPSPFTIRLLVQWTHKCMLRAKHSDRSIDHSDS